VCYWKRNVTVSWFEIWKTGFSIAIITTGNSNSAWFWRFSPRSYREFSDFLGREKFTAPDINNATVDCRIFSDGELTGRLVIDDSYFGGLRFWTAGQRIDPSRNTTFIWRVTLPLPGQHNYSMVLPMTYTNWRVAQPDFARQAESCMHLLYSYSYEWNDESCSSEYYSVCELDMWVHLTTIAM